MEKQLEALRPRSILRCKKKFLKAFPKGFYDETYLSWERDYKWAAHLRWKELLGPKIFKKLLDEENFFEIANRAVKVESRTNLLFSFEKMALRDALKTSKGAEVFAQGLFVHLYGKGPVDLNFKIWCETVESLPVIQTRVLTWPIVTVFGFLARPDQFCYLKPTVTKKAAENYGYPFVYHSRPSWESYERYLKMCEQVMKDLKDLKPRDMIDIQSFLWVQGSDEY